MRSYPAYSECWFDPNDMLDKYEKRVKQEKKGATSEELSELCNLLRRLMEGIDEMRTENLRRTSKYHELEYRVSSAIEIITGKSYSPEDDKK